MATADATKGSPIEEIYKKINDLFGNGSTDVFQMEFPARLLEGGNYQYTGSDTINAQQVKPPAVAEAEFRLANDMFEISNLVGGPNGSKNEIMEWLEEKVDNFDPPSSDMLEGIPSNLGLRVGVSPQYAPKISEHTAAIRDPTKTPKIPRIDLYQKLFDTYEAERCRWVQFKNDNRPLNTKDQDAMDGYDRLLMTYAPVVDAKLEALWTLLLVRGQYHRVRKYIGYIDIETPSEVLLKAKESLRSSACRSIDDTEDIYPVVFTPANWAKNLSTNFKPEDLLNSTAAINDKLFAAEKNRSALLLRKNQLLAGKQDISKLEDAQQAAQRAYSDAQTKMTQGYGDTAIKLFQLYYNAQTKNSSTGKMGSGKAEEFRDVLKKSSQPAISDEQFKQLCDMQDECLQKQQNMTTASENYSRANLTLEQAKVTDSSNLIGEIDDQINSLGMDIEYYNKLLGSTDNPFKMEIKAPVRDKEGNVTEGAVPQFAPKIPEKPTLPETSDSASIWQEVTASSTYSSSKSSSMSHSAVSDSSWETGFWFASGGGSSHSSEGSSDKSSQTSSMDIDIAFRAMKVDIQRPWMNAAILGQTQDYFRGPTEKISADDPVALKSKLRQGNAPVNSGNSLLPSFTTSFIVVKDVHLIFKGSDATTMSNVADSSQSNSSSGGCLCFSYSKSSSSSDHRESASVVASGNSLSVKIAAPQIIGWISQLAPTDNTPKEYTRLPKDEFQTAAPKTGN